MRLRNWLVAVSVLPVCAAPALAERTGNEFRCDQIQDVCAHLSKAFGKDFNTGNLISEVQVAELEPFLPQARFLLTNVSTKDVEHPAVDLLAVRSPRDKQVVSSVSPILRDTDPDFLGLFEGIVVADTKQRAAFAGAIAKVLEEMTYAGSVSGLESDGPTATAVLHYKGKPLRRVDVAFAPDGKVERVRVTAASKEKNPKSSHKPAGTSPDLFEARTVEAVVQALAGGALPSRSHVAEVRSSETDRVLTIARTNQGHSVQFSACGEQSGRALDVTLQVTVQHGLYTENLETNDGCTSFKLGGIKHSEALADIVARVCGEVFGWKADAPVLVTKGK